MAKRKASLSNAESSGNDDVGSVHKQEHIFPSPSKKLKKRKKQKVYNSDSSEEENVSNTSIRSVHKSSVDKTIVKKNVQNKCSANDSFKKELSTSYDQVMRSTSEDSESDSEASGKSRLIKKSSFKHTKSHNIKKEVLSDNGELYSETESDHSSKSVVNKNINKAVIIKEEVQDTSSSEFEGENDGTSSIRSKHLVPESSSITILQDIKLIPKTAKQKMEELYPGLKRIEEYPELNLSDSDEIYLLRIPKNVDPKLLKKMDISLESECKINIGENYLITPTMKVPDPTLVISASSKVLQFKNNIKMEKYIKSKAEPEITVPEKKSVPLQDNLKKRHPLFGSDFNQKITLNERVEQKLDEAIANLLRREKKSKKKKEKKNKHVDQESTPDQEIFNLLNTHRSLASHDVIKKENSDDSAFGSSCSVDKPKSKKKEKAVVQEIEPPAEEVVSERESKSPKKKKSKHSHDRDLLEISNIKKEIEDTGAMTTDETDSVSSKKRKKKSIINSTLMSDLLKTPQFDSEISTIASEASTPAKKSKKSKRDKEMKQEIGVKREDLISELLNDVTVKLHTPRKIKMEF